MISLTAKYLVAMKFQGVFVHRMTVAHGGEFINCFGEDSVQELMPQQIESMRTVLVGTLISKFHDKFEVVIGSSVVVTPEELYRGDGVVTQ